jgi:hypothetical protein
MGESSSSQLNTIMAWLFELAAECGGNRNAAILFAKHFDGLRLRCADDFEAICTSQHSPPTGDEENNWWVEIIPSGLSKSGVQSEADAKRMTEVGILLYRHLETAPPFRFALVGVETSQFCTANGILKVLQHPAMDGLVVNDELWQQLGSPDGFETFGKGYRWRPYAGETVE